MSYNSGVIMLVISNQPRTMHLADLKSLSQLLPELYSTHAVLLLLLILIHQILLLTRDWSKHVTWANIPQIKLGNIQYSPIFKTDGS